MMTFITSRCPVLLEWLMVNFAASVAASSSSPRLKGADLQPLTFLDSNHLVV